MPRTIHIGLCGLGVVGQGVWKHLARTRRELGDRFGVRLDVRRVAVRRRGKRRLVRVPAALLTDDPMAVATDPGIDIVCELMGGTDEARRVTLAALSRGKAVVSANKALICGHGAEIFATAKRHGGTFHFEASVAGCIPIIKSLREGLVANHFPLIYGILNGTCNYILTRMGEEGAPYAGVLAETKRLGYAEADESLDVSGMDTAHKASILAWLAHGVWVPTDRMIVEGIRGITPADLSHAADLGYRIKLLGIIERKFAGGELSVRVHPTLLPATGVIANVNGIFNGISVTGDVAGTTVYIGGGAGQDPTASAVIADIVEAARLVAAGGQADYLRDGGSPEGIGLTPPSRIASRYYVRLMVRDQPGMLARIASALGVHRVSIASVVQKPSERPGLASLVLTTHRSDERAMRLSLKSLARLGSAVEPPLLMRIGDFSA